MKSIFFTADEITRILRGEITQCRRVIKPQPQFYISEMTINSDWHDGKPVSTWDCTRVYYKCYPPYQVNTIIYCKEPWNNATSDYITYKTTDNDAWWTLWHPAITMPEWASRCKLRIVAVRAEKLTEISTKDANASGYKYCVAFDNDWNAKNPKYPWSSQPWVWVYSFEQVKP